MKFSASLLAVCAFGSLANAFTVTSPVAYKTSLNSMRTAERTTEGVGTTATPSRTGPEPTRVLLEEAESQIVVQGGSLRTCSFPEEMGRATVYMKTEGRPLNANVDLWQGPDNTPQRMAIYLEDGSKRPFRCMIETPGSSNSVSIRNTAQLEYPLTAGIDGEYGETAKLDIGDYRTVQGGAVYTTPFAPAVQSIRVSLKTDGRPMNARVELLQGPNNNKQVMEIYTEDGLERPFTVIIDSPGVGNVVRIVNTATVEFPISAAIEPYLIDDTISSTDSTGMTWR